VSWARIGSAPNLRSCKLAGRPRAKRTRTYRPNFCASKLVEGLKKHLLLLLFNPDDRLSHAGTGYRDLGPEYFARRNPAKLAAKLANRIRNLGYHVEISAAA